MQELTNKISFDVIADFQYDLHKCKTMDNLKKRVRALIDDLVHYAYPNHHVDIVENCDQPDNQSNSV